MSPWISFLSRRDLMLTFFKLNMAVLHNILVKFIYLFIYLLLLLLLLLLLFIPRHIK